MGRQYAASMAPRLFSSGLLILLAVGLLLGHCHKATFRNNRTSKVTILTPQCLEGLEDASRRMPHSNAMLGISNKQTRTLRI